MYGQYGVQIDNEAGEHAFRTKRIKSTNRGDSSISDMDMQKAEPIGGSNIKFRVS